MSNQNFRSILTGSFSTPCADNPTVAMIEAAYHHAGIDARYINCDVSAAHLAAAVKGAVAMEWVGFNCSLPHKVAVIDHLDELAQAARIIGAVNCVTIRDGRLIGNNTDGKGFLASLRDVTDPAGKKVFLLGAGGAARAIAVELGLAGTAHITVANRDPEKAETIAALVRDNTGSAATGCPWVGKARIPEGTDIVINATSVGLGDGQAMPEVDLDTLAHGQIVADVIPNPPRTRFLREARARGCTPLDGLGMLVNQGVIGVELWLGKTLDAGVMQQTLRDIFGASDTD
ncbi:Shikimate dehydrogenase [Gluconacetobacter sp. SXCC-1]|uniref:Shikimate dehydrogenase (NADP(+)) n=1 Tax=Komagataeibacter rhaeticus TaxID=215221 RepID=A0A181CCT6_9PROT|nr:shikimate dehydrogenase [Komagataeibacter rhaeticus]ATU71799.1 shikimate dehydrogenase [Komagataeibacter xylinus]EGG75765.1 Shikimate dehydrogenase [Gluconacetobacter sp. SXCC-1]QIP36086.1 shikimate dehydrogenase [Komagataeibacter rhaeticus]QOC45847.1 shikimate dehydrogenase [Komagataeibacter rhaeticus]WPP21481.1 shikimate dehydrogenase [Komagataeibacter rhaeticus]